MANNDTAKYQQMFDRMSGENNELKSTIKELEDKNRRLQEQLNV
jgi:predicted RNase H-like nuclease (RuvC/YqgF family)